MDPWSWFVEKFDEDPAGWISLLILVAGVVTASFWGRRIFHWVRAVPGRIDRWLRRRYAATPSAVATTIAVRFETSHSPREKFGEYMTGRLAGGRTSWTVTNLGPVAAEEVRVEFVSPELQAETAPHWPTLAVGEAGTFTAFVPFGKGTDSRVVWHQGGESFSRDIKLLFEAG
ncbi:hypothetical protein [Microbacterium ureisolvens]|uniref:Uncharacterized protein n=1 Tax=Microbacterium ureisolvens TaxID=2781186 RepID=A0ABS7I1M3_9MICO|nr:hypothetical protein [Microbacterium ureisolvens]MBW9110655.1 hypothetical protein [Microbacterium ureisolvens]